MTEQWKDVVGWEKAYEVSNLGNVRSKDRWFISARKQRRFYKGYLLTPHPDKDGYLKVILRYRGTSKNKLVHRLVLESYDGPCPKKCQGCHNDGDKTNNTPPNLRWDTSKNNNADKRKHETLLLGEGCHFSKLKNSEVSLIKKLLCESTIPMTKIRKMFKISRYTVTNINNGYRWSHIEYKKDEQFPIRLYDKGRKTFTINC